MTDRTKRGKKIDPLQHCTSKKCGYTFSHTASWCGVKQTKRCKCPFDYGGKYAERCARRERRRRYRLQSHIDHTP